MNFVILANGQAPSKGLMDRLLVACDCLVATDGAAHGAYLLGLEPDMICGDFDSIDLVWAQRVFPGAEFVETSDQYLGDLEKALRLSVERGAIRVTVAGGTGGRLDHLIGNLTLLLNYEGVLDLRLVDELSEARCIAGKEGAPGRCELATVEHDTISVFSFDGRARASITGVRWPLDNVLLPVGTLGLSNVATSTEVTVSVRDGALIVVHTHLCADLPGDA